MQPFALGQGDGIFISGLEVMPGLDEPSAKPTIARFFSPLLPNGATIVAASPSRAAASAMLCPWLPVVAVTTPWISGCERLTSSR